MIIEGLRIGNLVNEANRMNSKTLLTGETVYIESKIMGLGKYGCRILQGVNYKDILIDVLQPIPLTEEWLEKFGFKKLGDWFIKKPLLSVNEYAYNPYIKQFDVISGNGEEIGLVELKYVHQLQNLYFALTGEELLIKE